MRRELSTLTEWMWSEGHLLGAAELEVWVDHLAQLLRAKNPRSRIYLKLAKVEIEKDVKRTLRVLRYGGRNPKALSPERKDQLKRQFLSSYALVLDGRLSAK